MGDKQRVQLLGEPRCFPAEQLESDMKLKAELLFIRFTQSEGANVASYPLEVWKTIVCRIGVNWKGADKFVVVLHCVYTATKWPQNDSAAKKKKN